MKTYDEEFEVFKKFTDKIGLKITDEMKTKFRIGYASNVKFNTENKTLDEYVNDNYPLVMKEYFRYIHREQLPKIGENVTTLRAGFGTIYAGRVLTVKEIDNWNITLTNGDDDYISEIKVWYKELKVN